MAEAAMIEAEEHGRHAHLVAARVAHMPVSVLEPSRPHLHLDRDRRMTIFAAEERKNVGHRVLALICGSDADLVVDVDQPLDPGEAHILSICLRYLPRLLRIAAADMTGEPHRQEFGERRARTARLLSG